MSDLRDPLTGRSGTTTGGDYEVRRAETAAAISAADPALRQRARLRPVPRREPSQACAGA